MLANLKKAETDARALLEVGEISKADLTALQIQFSADALARATAASALALFALMNASRGSSSSSSDFFVSGGKPVSGSVPVAGVAPGARSLLTQHDGGSGECGHWRRGHHTSALSSVCSARGMYFKPFWRLAAATRVRGSGFLRPKRF